MKIILTADWHINERNRLTDFMVSFKKIINYCVVNKITTLIIAGDVYDNWYTTPIERYHIYSLFKQAIANNIHIYMLIGNHDISEVTGIHSLEDFKALSEHVTVIDVPQVINIGDFKIGWLPHIAEYALGGISFQKYIENTLKKYDVDMWVGHILLKSAVPASAVSARAVDDAVFNGIKIPVFLGDIHNCYVSPNNPYVNYIGSADRISFSEATDSKSFIVYDTDVLFKPANIVRESIICRSLTDIIINLKESFGTLNGNVFKVTNIANISEIINNFKTAIKDSILKIRIIGSSTELSLISRPDLLLQVAAMKPHSIKFIKFINIDNTSVRDSSYTELITPKLAFNKWLKSKDIDNKLRDRVKIVGNLILNNETS